MRGGSEGSAQWIGKKYAQNDIWWGFFSTTRFRQGFRPTPVHCPSRVIRRETPHSKSLWIWSFVHFPHFNKRDPCKICSEAINTRARVNINFIAFQAEAPVSVSSMSIIMSQHLLGWTPDAIYGHWWALDEERYGLSRRSSDWIGFPCVDPTLEKSCRSGDAQIMSATEKNTFQTELNCDLRQSPLVPNELAALQFVPNKFQNKQICFGNA